VIVRGSNPGKSSACGLTSSTFASQERDTHKKELQDLNSKIHSGEVDKVEAVQRVSKKADEERLFLEGEVHRVNVSCWCASMNSTVRVVRT